MSEPPSRWLTVTVAFVLAGCAALSPPDFVDGSVGLASWYGRAHHGQRTASGERFDMHAFTAAHRTLPFGTLVRVINLENARTVVVRINDRGPYARGRVIDVSHAAAQALGMRSGGLVRVRLELVPGTP
jgi:rare lipoprotein A